MKIFGTAIVAVVALCAIAAISLSYFQETVAQAYSVSADRLDQQESVNFYGRQTTMSELPAANTQLK
jgi:hypothetical protein